MPRQTAEKQFIEKVRDLAQALAERDYPGLNLMFEVDERGTRTKLAIYARARVIQHDVKRKAG